MEVATPTTGSFQSSAAQAASGAKKDGAVAAADFETFLTLLTSQMRNQDPLNPMDSTQFVAQLADFSSVEQQVKTNDMLESILNALGGGSAAAADWIGKDVQTETLARFDGEPVEIAFPPGDPAQTAQMTVFDEAGVPVARLPVDPAAATVLWDGRINGEPAKNGLYSFTQTRGGADGLAQEIDGAVFAEVTEVRFGQDGERLILENGREISPDEVRALRPS